MQYIGEVFNTNSKIGKRRLEEYSVILSLYNRNQYVHILCGLLIVKS